MYDDKIYVGDYVLATKYSDGDPAQQWAVGTFRGAIYHGLLRYEVAVENEMAPALFSQIKKIKHWQYEWLNKYAQEISNGNDSLWSILDKLNELGGGNDGYPRECYT